MNKITTTATTATIIKIITLILTIMIMIIIIIIIIITTIKHKTCQPERECGGSSEKCKCIILLTQMFRI